MLDLIRTRQEKWKCRLEEMSSDRTTKRVYVGVMEGRRPRGRPRMRWTDNFKSFTYLLPWGSHKYFHLFSDTVL